MDDFKKHQQQEYYNLFRKTDTLSVNGITYNVVDYRAPGEDEVFLQFTTTDSLNSHRVDSVAMWKDDIRFILEPVPLTATFCGREVSYKVINHRCATAGELWLGSNGRDLWLWDRGGQTQGEYDVVTLIDEDPTLSELQDWAAAGSKNTG